MAERKGFPLRLDPQLYDELQRWAAAELRSVNGQIEYLLRCALQAAGRLPGSDRGTRPESPHAKNKQPDSE
ncbi:MAG: toxin-antitoxin system HicB family antitoxin [Vicinamibacterales bacterium]